MRGHTFGLSIVTLANLMAALQFATKMPGVSNPSYRTESPWAPVPSFTQSNNSVTNASPEPPLSLAPKDAQFAARPDAPLRSEIQPRRRAGTDVLYRNIAIAFPVRQ